MGIEWKTNFRFAWWYWTSNKQLSALIHNRPSQRPTRLGNKMMETAINISSKQRLFLRWQPHNRQWYRHKNRIIVISLPLVFEGMWYKIFVAFFWDNVCSHLDTSFFLWIINVENDLIGLFIHSNKTLYARLKSVSELKFQ